MGSRPNIEYYKFEGTPYTNETRPCSYCTETWLDKRSTYGSIIGINASNFLTKVGQLNTSTGKTTWTWVCPTCLENLKREIAKPVDYMLAAEQNAAATIRILDSERKEEGLDPQCIATI